jgi:hypothetical protein
MFYNIKKSQTPDIQVNVIMLKNANVEGDMLENVI